MNQALNIYEASVASHTYTVEASVDRWPSTVDRCSERTSEWHNRRCHEIQKPVNKKIFSIFNKI